MSLAAPLVLDQLQIARQDIPLCQPVTAHIAAGEIWHITGRNGAGKSTLLLTLAGVLPATAATLRWDELPVTQWPLLWIGHQTGIQAGLTVQENLAFLAGSLGLTVSTTELHQALQQVGLAGYEDELVRRLSSGQKRRVALAQLWLPQLPTLWLLDEPLVALDTAMIQRLETRFAAHIASGGRIILTSHQPLTLPVQTLALLPAYELAAETVA